MGRPSKFAQAVADALCERIAVGESLRAICSDEEMPSQSMVFRWLAANDLFREQYARAREAQADALFDEILDIADDGRNDWMLAHGDDDENAPWRVNGEHIQRSKLRLEARKWMASKLQPKKYGDKVTLGGDAENPVNSVVTHRIDDDTIERVRARLRGG